MNSLTMLWSIGEYVLVCQQRPLKNCLNGHREVQVSRSHEAKPWWDAAFKYPLTSKNSPPIVLRIESNTLLKKLQK